MRKKVMLKFAVLLAAFPLFWMGSSAHAFDGLVVSELPAGGDVTVPGDYPILIPTAVDVILFGLTTPQALTFTNHSSASSTVRVFASHERKTRTINLKPGTSAVYNFRDIRPVRVRVTSGDVKVNSIHPLKIQR